MKRTGPVRSAVGDGYYMVAESSQQAAQSNKQARILSPPIQQTSGMLYSEIQNLSSIGKLAISFHKMDLFRTALVQFSQTKKVLCDPKLEPTYSITSLMVTVFYSFIPKYLNIHFSVPHSLQK